MWQEIVCVSGTLPKDFGEIFVRGNTEIQGIIEIEEDANKNQYPVKSRKFDVCPNFQRKDFDARTVTDGHVYFSREQDAALVRGISRYGTTDWGIIRMMEPCLKGVGEPKILEQRWELIKDMSNITDIDEKQHFRTFKGINGKEQIGVNYGSDADELDDRLVDLDGYESNDDFCAECADTGDLLCCDSCPRSFHLSCAGLTEEPTSSLWNCQYCQESGALDIVDDTELSEEEVRRFKHHWADLQTSKQQATKFNSANPTGEGMMTKSLRKMIDTPDDYYDRITKELELSSKFVSVNISKAESAVLNQYALMEEERQLQAKNDANAMVDEDGENRKDDGSPSDEDLEKEDDEDEEDEEEEDEDDVDDDVEDEEEEEDDEEDDDEDDDDDDDDMEEDDDDEDEISKPPPITLSAPTIKPPLMDNSVTAQASSSASVQPPPVVNRLVARRKEKPA